MDLQSLLGQQSFHIGGLQDQAASGVPLYGDRLNAINAGMSPCCRTCPYKRDFEMRQLAQQSAFSGCQQNYFGSILGQRYQDPWKETDFYKWAENKAAKGYELWQ